MYWQASVIVVLICALFYRWKSRHLIKLSNQLPTNLRAFPILGHVAYLMGNAHDRMMSLQLIGRDTYNFDGIASFWLLRKLFVIVSNAEAAEVIMKKCLSKDDLMDLLKPLIGNGSIFAPVPIWRPRRKVLAPIFGQRTLNNFVQIFSKQSAILVKQLNQGIMNKNISIFKYVTTYSMDSVCETTLGVEVHAQSDPDHPFLKAFTGFCQIAAHRIMRPWLYSDLIHKLTPTFSTHQEHVYYLHNFVEKIVKSKQRKIDIDDRKKKRKDSCDEDNKKTKPFLELLLESSDHVYNDLELREETLVLVLAGTDTSAVGISFTALMLAKYPEVQEKVYQEIEKYLGDSETHIKADDLPKLKYLDAVVKETLRIFPPIPVIVRKVEHSVKLPSGVTLVPGTGVVIHIWALHRNPKYWGDDADVFRPERFFDSPPTHPAAFLPFSYGPRNCLGYQYAMMSMKTALASLVKSYRLLPPRNADGSIKVDFIKNDAYFPVKFEIMMKHTDNFEIQLERRN